MTQDVMLSSGYWQALLSHLPDELGLSNSAFELGAFRQARGVPSAEALLRLAIAYAASPLSLSGAAAWAAASEVARISDVALLSRLRQAERWIGLIAGRLLPVRLPCEASRLRRRLLAVDATSIAPPGQHSWAWRLHASYDLVAGHLDHIEMTGATGGQALARFPLREGDIAICDGGYGHVQDIAAARRSGADIVVAVAWNNIVLHGEDGQKLGIIARLPAEAAAVGQHSRLGPRLAPPSWRKAPTTEPTGQTGPTSDGPV